MTAPFEVPPFDVSTLDTTRDVITVDPGDEHVGVAVWGWVHRTKRWQCDLAQEVTPMEFVRLLEDHLYKDQTALVVFETFQLYADKAGQQTGSDFPTPQLIGIIKYLVSLYPDVGLVGQPASIKKATLAVLRKKRVVSVAKTSGRDPDGHGFDAETHGYHFFGRNELPVLYPTKVKK